MSVGGGLGVPYVDDETAPTIGEWGKVVRDACAAAGVTATILAEPGRSIAAAAAVTLYTVGTIKEIEGVRTYVSVDGGMSDNPRPVLYGSGYETFLRGRSMPTDAADPPRRKHCESGDIWFVRVSCPAISRRRHPRNPRHRRLRPLDGLQLQQGPSSTGRVRRDGDARLVVRRETFDDLTRLDV